MINKQQVQHIADLARLGLKEKEVKKMQKELAKILDYIDLLKQADVSKIRPASHLAMKNVMREDKVKSASKETVGKILEQAPEKQGDFVKVKEVLK